MAGTSPIQPDNGGVPPPAIDTEKPHPARVYDYFLGGKDNFAADREVAAQAPRSWPTVRTAVRENRAFIGRAVRCLTAEGIDQFLDIGSGLPSRQNVHEVAQSVTPGPTWSMWTTIRSCSRTPGPCSPALPTASAPISTLTFASRRRSWKVSRFSARWTSPGPSG